MTSNAFDACQTLQLKISKSTLPLHKLQQHKCFLLKFFLHTNNYEIVLSVISILEHTVAVVSHLSTFPFL